MDIISVYDDVAKDNANKDENGYLSYEMFNRMSKRAELLLMEWLTGDISGVTPPEPYLTQKNKDFLSQFIKKHLTQVVNGAITRPTDYYQYENFYIIGSRAQSDCEDEDNDIPVDQCNTPIELLDGDKFNERCTTYISELKPSLKKPIAKQVGRTFETMPRDLGSVTLEYIRYPEFGKIVTKPDPVYNDQVPDPAASTNYEWDENARGILIWFITNSFADHTREQALKQFNAATGKTVRP